MAGEIIKGTVQANITSVANVGVDVVSDNNGNSYLNEIAGYNLDTDHANILNILNSGNSGITSGITKLAVDQGKAFVTTQQTFDANVTSANVANTIKDRIDQWIGAHGIRFDEFSFNVNPSGANHDVTVVIIRYF
jgi:hypothetical protein